MESTLHLEFRSTRDLGEMQGIGFREFGSVWVLGFIEFSSVGFREFGSVWVFGFIEFSSVGFIGFSSVGF